MEDEKIIKSEELKKAGGAKKSFPFVVVLFSSVLIFFVIQGILLWKHHSISAYNVSTPAYDNVTGSVRGIVIRDEACIASQDSGYVTLYKQDGDFVSEGDTLLLSSPESHLNETIRAIASQNDFSNQSLRKITDTLKSDAAGYDSENFESVFEMKTNIQEAVFSRLLTDNSSFETYLKTMSVSRLTAKESGFFMSWTDGFEVLSVDRLSSDMVQGRNYHRDTVRSGERRNLTDPVGKIALDNKFEIAFLIDDAVYSIYQQKKNLTIRTQDGLELTGDFRTGMTTDGKRLGILSFPKYGAYFLSSRYVDFAVLDKQVYGYKIPESSITTKSFFVVPEEYVVTGGDNGKPGLLVFIGDRFIYKECTVYRRAEGEDRSIVKEEGYCYVQSPEIQRGILIHNSNVHNADYKEMTIGQEIPVEGVFQINSGYCVFKPIARIQNSLDTAYVVVSSKAAGTIRAYDRILLDAANFAENEFLFE